MSVSMLRYNIQVGSIKYIIRAWVSYNINIAHGYNSLAGATNLICVATCQVLLAKCYRYGTPKACWPVMEVLFFRFSLDPGQGCEGPRRLTIPPLSCFLALFWCTEMVTKGLNADIARWHIMKGIMLQ